MPAKRSPSGRFVDWADLLERRIREPGWALEFPNASLRTAHTINQKRHRLLRRVDGHLEADPANVYVDPSGIRRGDIWVRWVYHHPKRGAT